MGFNSAFKGLTQQIAPVLTSALPLHISAATCSQLQGGTTFKDTYSMLCNLPIYMVKMAIDLPFTIDRMHNIPYQSSVGRAP